MFNSLFSNKKRKIRNIILILLSTVIAVIALPLTAYFIFGTTVALAALICTLSVFIIAFLVTFVLALLSNKRDAALRHKFMLEKNNQDSSVMLSANGIDVSKTNRDKKQIKAEITKLMAEFYHANERDKNLKLASKF